MNKRFDVVFLPPVWDFFETLTPKAVSKIYYNLNRAATEIDRSVFKKLAGTDIWEFRSEYSGTQYRLLAFWDASKAAMVVATHGFIKKAQKTPTKEIERAEALMKQYYLEKRLEK